MCGPLPDTGVPRPPDRGSAPVNKAVISLIVYGLNLWLPIFKNLSKSTVDGLIFVGYQFSWFSWRVQSTNSSTHELVILCVNYEGKYNGYKF